MNDRSFGKRLAQELARWQEEGWVSAEGRQAILTDLAARQPKMVWASSLALGAKRVRLELKVHHPPPYPQAEPFAA